jgi:hypothetical protein
MHRLFDNGASEWRMGQISVDVRWESQIAFCWGFDLAARVAAT